MTYVEAIVAVGLQMWLLAEALGRLEPGRLPAGSLSADHGQRPLPRTYRTFATGHAPVES
jgi:hypothetical protein